MYPYYSQRDTKWGNVTFSPAKLKIRDKGCTLTVLASMATWAGKTYTPEMMAEKCEFTDDGLLLWVSVPLPLNFVWRYKQYDKKKAKEILLSKNGMCMIQVMFGGSQHWIGLIGWDRNGEIIHDPWDGKKKSLKMCPFSAPIGMTELRK